MSVLVMQAAMFSIISLWLAGLSLSCHFLAGRFDKFKPFESILSNRLFRLIIGISSLICGLFNLLYFGELPLVNDLLPALFGLLMGVILICDYLKQTHEIDHAVINKILLLLKAEAVIGIGGVIIGTLHLIMPSIAFF